MLASWDATSQLAATNHSVLWERQEKDRSFSQASQAAKDCLEQPPELPSLSGVQLASRPSAQAELQEMQLTSRSLAQVELQDASASLICAQASQEQVAQSARKTRRREV